MARNGPANGDATAWDPNANAWVNALAMSDGTVHAGGGFTSISGQARNFLAALDPSGVATLMEPESEY